MKQKLSKGEKYPNWFSVYLIVRLRHSIVKKEMFKIQFYYFYYFNVSSWVQRFCRIDDDIVQTSEYCWVIADLRDV